MEHRLDFPIWFKGIRLAIEEGSELLGTLLILTGVVQQRKEIDGNFVTKVIAKPLLGLPFKQFLWVGLLVHSLICYFIIPSLNDLSVRGDPGSFYPALVGFILFCFFFWKSKESESWKMYLVLALVFLFSSMSCIYNLGKIISSVGIGITFWFVRERLFIALYLVNLRGISFSDNYSESR